MNETYGDKLRQEISFLSGQLKKLQGEIADAGDTAEYTKLMRMLLATQKQYLKLSAELENLTKSKADELTVFNGA